RDWRSHAPRGQLGKIDGGADSERNRDQQREQRRDQRAEDERQRSEVLRHGIPVGLHDERPAEAADRWPGSVSHHRRHPGYYHDEGESGPTRELAEAAVAEAAPDAASADERRKDRRL